MYRGFGILTECIEDFGFWRNVSRIWDFDGMYRGFGILRECIEDLGFGRNASRIWDFDGMYKGFQSSCTKN